jgi:acyl-coenzyme A thioesterase PaaI-like protein
VVYEELASAFLAHHKQYLLLKAGKLLPMSSLPLSLSLSLCENHISFYKSTSNFFNGGVIATLLDSVG